MRDNKRVYDDGLIGWTKEMQHIEDRIWRERLKGDIFKTAVCAIGGTCVLAGVLILTGESVDVIVNDSLIGFFLMAVTSFIGMRIITAHEASKWRK